MKISEYLKQKSKPVINCSWFNYRFFDGTQYSSLKSMYYNSIDFPIFDRKYNMIGEPKFYGTDKPLLFTLYGKVKK